MKTILIKSPRLPNKLSALLRTAVADMAAVRKDPRYKLDMTRWHYPTANKKCAVCMAGAVLARRARVPASRDVNVDDVTPALLKKMLAIDRMRTGNFAGAFVQLFGDEARITTGQAAGIAWAREEVIASYQESRNGRARARDYAYITAVIALEAAGL